MKEVVDATLTKIQKNQILKVILEFGPPPEDFQWTEKQQEEWSEMHTWPYRVSVLTHRPTEYFCIFGAHSVTTSPGLSKKVEDSRHEDKWAKKVDACGKWLVILKLEVDAPDLWATIGQEKALSTAASSADLDNRPFTAAEQNLIATKLDEIKAYLLEGQQFDKEQAEFVKTEFAYLRQSAARFGRKDWLRVLLGVLIGQAINLALDPAKARGLFSLAGAAFQSLWGTVQGLLQ
jgi:hypothetical protein